MNQDAALTVRYWGTTGSIPRPLTPEAMAAKVARVLRALRDPELANAWAALPDTEEAALAFVKSRLAASLHSTAGGNSTCIEIEAGDQCLLVDAGSGLRVWGDAVQRRQATLANNAAPLHAHLFLTHAHLDHLIGISACDPFFRPQNDVTIWASASVIHRLHGLLQRPEHQRSPLSGVTLGHLAAIRNWNVLEHNAIVQIGDTVVEAFACNHPGEALAYRFERLGRSVVIATDHEHLTMPDERLAQFAHDADLVYMDAQYGQCEYKGEEGIGEGEPQSRQGWGHGTFEACIETALHARCHRLHLGHHDPQRDDEGLETLEQLAKLHLAQRLESRVDDSSTLEVELAREGTSISLSPLESHGITPCPAD